MLHIHPSIHVLLLAEGQMARLGNVSESKAVAEIGEQWRVEQCVYFIFFVTKMNCDFVSVSSWRHLIRRVRSHFVV
jgi:hypothetical protein